MNCSFIKKIKPHRKYWRTVKIVGYLVIPLTLLSLPSTYFDSGESICVSKRWLDMECYGCGMTKGAMHLLHFDFQEAWDFNKLSFIVMPLVGLLWTKQFLKEFDINVLKWL